LKSSNSPKVPDDYFHIGKVIGVHGIRGALKVYSYAESSAYYAPGSVLVLMDEAGDLKTYTITGSGPHKKIWRLTLADVATRNQAEGLIGRTVLVHRADLPDLEEDTYYWADLLGMAVYNNSGDYLGRVRHIIPTGANDVYVVGTDTGEGAAEILVPAIESVVLDIDIDQHRMRVELPEGLE
jgi:16S rRNA processing protein RimM